METRKEDTAGKSGNGRDDPVPEPTATSGQAGAFASGGDTAAATYNRIQKEGVLYV